MVPFVGPTRIDREREAYWPHRSCRVSEEATNLLPTNGRDRLWESVVPFEGHFWLVE